MNIIMPENQPNEEQPTPQILITVSESGKLFGFDLSEDPEEAEESEG